MKLRYFASPIAACLLAAMAAVPVAQARQEERPLRRFTIPTLVTAVAFAPDNQTLVAWDPAGWSRWDAGSGRQREREVVIAKACERVAALPRSEDGRVIGVQCRNRLFFFEAATARALGERPLSDKQTAAIYTAAPGGSAVALVMAGATDTVSVGGMSGGQPGTELRIAAEVEQLILSASGTRLTAGTSRGVEVRDLPGGTLLRTIEGGPSHALSADGRTMALVSAGGVRVVDADTGGTTRELEGRVAHLRFSPDGRLLVGWTNQRLIVWDVATGTQRLVLSADEFVAASISPDGQLLATAGLERRGEGTSSVIAFWRLPELPPAR